MKKEDIRFFKENGETWVRVSDIANAIGIGGHRNWGKDLNRLSAKLKKPCVMKVSSFVSNGKGVMTRDVLYTNKDGIFKILHGKDNIGNEVGYYLARVVL